MEDFQHEVISKYLDKFNLNSKLLHWFPLLMDFIVNTNNLLHQPISLCITFQYLIKWMYNSPRTTWMTVWENIAFQNSFVLNKTCDLFTVQRENRSHTHTHGICYLKLSTHLCHQQSCFYSLKWFNSVQKDTHPLVSYTVNIWLSKNMMKLTEWNVQETVVQWYGWGVSKHSENIKPTTDHDGHWKLFKLCSHHCMCVHKKELQCTKTN